MDRTTNEKDSKQVAKLVALTGLKAAVTIVNPIAGTLISVGWLTTKLYRKINKKY